MKNYEMNLQMFAEAPVNNTTAMTAEMKTFYEKRLIDQAEPRLVHDQFADYYPVPQNGGKTIEFRKYDSLPKAATPLTEGVTPNGQTLNVTTITSDLHQYGGWTPLTDVLQMTAIDNNVVQATRVLASQVAARWTASPAMCWRAAPTSSMRPSCLPTALRPPWPAARHWTRPAP